MFPSYVTPIIGLTVEGQVTRFAGYRDAAVKFHVTFKSRVNFIIFAAFFANEGTAFSVNRGGSGSLSKLRQARGVGGCGH